MFNFKAVVFDLDGTLIDTEKYFKIANVRIIELLNNETLF